MERIQRLTLFAFTIILLCTATYKGRASSEQVSSAAFSPFSSAAVIAVRLTGNVPLPGIYNVPECTPIRSVIKLTAGEAPLEGPDLAEAETFLSSGDVVDVLENSPKNFSISIRKMGAGEKILLCLPLHPDSMDVSDWDDLPGVGPVMAQRITTDRQNNGDFHTFDGLLRVSGMGATRLNSIRKYF